MNWSNLAPTILEKVMFYSAQKEQQRDNRGRIIAPHTWLLTIEKFCRVSTHWKNVAFSSEKLFPENKSIEFNGKRWEEDSDEDSEEDSEEDLEEAKILLKAGFLSMVKGLRIGNSEVFKYTGNVMETSLISIHTYDRKNIWWSEENVRSMMDLLSKSPNAKNFYFECLIDSVPFWQLLLKMVHCNSKPKNIDLCTDYFYPAQRPADWQTGQTDWEFIKSSEVSGIGSIESLSFRGLKRFEDPLQRFQFYADAVSHLAKNIEINELVTNDIEFAKQVQAKCFKLEFYEESVEREEIDIDWTALKDFEKVIVKGVISALTEVVEEVDHPNVHFVLLEKFITLKTNDIRNDTISRVPIDLIYALSASKVKTITYPGAATDSLTSKFFYNSAIQREFLPVPETTFACDVLLCKNIENFIDDAKVRFLSRLQTYFYLRKHSKTGEAKRENDNLENN